MSPDRKTSEWLKEFETFLRVDESAPPRTVTDAVYRTVKADLEPSVKLVAGKLFGLHALAIGLVTLVCPQLGVGPLIGGAGLMHFLMSFGRLPCAALCGALLLGTSAGVLSLFLRREELRLANRYRFLNVTLLVSISFAGLMIAGGEADQLSYLFWLLGAFTAGSLMMRLGALLRLGPKAGSIQMS